MRLPFEQFPALTAIEICRHVFTQRIPCIDVSHDKAEVLERLDAAHQEICKAIGIGDWPLITAEQVHGNKIAVIDEVETPRCGVRSTQRPDPTSSRRNKSRNETIRFSHR